MELPEGCRSRAAERHVADMPVPFAEGDGCPGPRKKPATTTLQYRTKLERIIRPLGSFTKPTTHYIGRHLVGYDGSSLLDKVHEMFGVEVSEAQLQDFVVLLKMHELVHCDEVVQVRIVPPFKSESNPNSQKYVCEYNTSGTAADPACPFSSCPNCDR